MWRMCFGHGTPIHVPPSLSVTCQCFVCCPAFSFTKLSSDHTFPYFFGTSHTFPTFSYFFGTIPTFSYFFGTSPTFPAFSYFFGTSPTFPTFLVPVLLFLLFPFLGVPFLLCPTFLVPVQRFLLFPTFLVPVRLYLLFFYFFLAPVLLFLLFPSFLVPVLLFLLFLQNPYFFLLCLFCFATRNFKMWKRAYRLCYYKCQQLWKTNYCRMIYLPIWGTLVVNVRLLNVLFQSFSFYFTTFSTFSILLLDSLFYCSFLDKIRAALNCVLQNVV